MKIKFFFIIFLLSITSISNASFGKPSSLDLYLNIDKGIENIENRMENFELEGGTKKSGILSEINKYAITNEKPACLNEGKSITPDEFRKIVENKDISSETGLMKYLIPNCIESLIKEEGEDKINKEYKDKENEALDKYDSEHGEWSEYYGGLVDAKEKYGDEEGTKKFKDTYGNYSGRSIVDITEDRDNSINELKKERNKKLSDYGKEGSKERETFLINIVTMYLDLFTTYKSDKETLAEIKSGQIYKISKIGLYADGDEENSGFDLITDIEDIDKIIFADVIDYEGKPNDSIDDALNSFLEPLVEKVEELSKPDFGNNSVANNNQDLKPIYSPIITPIKSDEKLKNTGSEYFCSENIQDNTLTQKTLSGLVQNITNELNGIKNNSGSNINTNTGNLDPIKLSPESSNNTNKSNYSKVTDNSEFPCEDIFCIDINFSTYEHSLFGGGENVTIEYLLNRSNKHLSKYAATSLIPAKMGTNEFELGLKDLNLPDVFHLSFQVSSKPIPILNIQDNSKKDNTEFSAKNMMEEYYEVNGLNYKRRNDLNLLKASAQNKQNTKNSAGLSHKELLEKQKENDQIVKERYKKAATLSKSINKRVSYGVLGTFDQQFTELDKFTVGINDYVNNLDSLVIQLKKIPIEY